MTARLVAQGQMSSSQESPHFQGPSSRDTPKIEVLFLSEDFTNHGYDYYLRLLALRKATGPLVTSVLSKRFGRIPTNDEFLAEVQSRLGRRGFLIAKKGLEAADSPNKLTDEHFVVMAILTAIMRGTEVLILTRDPDVLEQYVKLLCLMKEHYRAMLVAERYAASPGGDAISRDTHRERWRESPKVFG